MTHTRFADFVRFVKERVDERYGLFDRQAVEIDLVGAAFIWPPSCGQCDLRPPLMPRDADQPEGHDSLSAREGWSGVAPGFRSDWASLPALGPAVDTDENHRHHLHRRNRSPRRGRCTSPCRRPTESRQTSPTAPRIDRHYFCSQPRSPGKYRCDNSAASTHPCHHSTLRSLTPWPRNPMNLPLLPSFDSLQCSPSVGRCHDRRRLMPGWVHSHARTGRAGTCQRRTPNPEPPLLSGPCCLPATGRTYFLPCRRRWPGSRNRARSSSAGLPCLPGRPPACCRLRCCRRPHTR